ncbi:baseplate J/gp47 family protein [Propionivibrio sp.]|uniref:baseplate J/gp47 family protein n=1 Tax=Propionivibrio sp. TaxID=2212460 RepID=UPI003BF15F91
MAFQTKNFVTILLGLINRAKATQSKITDFRIGSVARTLFESPAAEIDELYQQMFIGLKESIPVAIYNSFSFDRLAATSSTGYIRVSITTSASVTLISAGTVFKSVFVGGTFTTSADLIIAAGSSYIDCLVTASVPGIVGNVVAGENFKLQPSLPGMIGAVSLSEFTSGKDIETDSQRKSRFANYIMTINRGTVAALHYGLSMASVTDSKGSVIEKALYTKIIEPWLTDAQQPVGHANAYIHNGVTGASASLLEDAQKRIDGYYDTAGIAVPGWKAAGVRVVVIAASNITVNVTGTVTVTAGFASTSVMAEVQSAVGNYIGALNIGSDALVAEIISSVMSVSGVENVAIAFPTVDVLITNTQKASVGTFALSAV